MDVGLSGSDVWPSAHTLNSRANQGFKIPEDLEVTGAFKILIVVYDSARSYMVSVSLTKMLGLNHA